MKQATRIFVLSCQYYWCLIKHKGRIKFVFIQLEGDEEKKMNVGLEQKPS